MRTNILEISVGSLLGRMDPGASSRALVACPARREATMDDR